MPFIFAVQQREAGRATSATAPQLWLRPGRAAAADNGLPHAPGPVCQHHGAAVQPVPTAAAIHAATAAPPRPGQAPTHAHPAAGGRAPSYAHRPAWQSQCWTPVVAGDAFDVAPPTHPRRDRVPAGNAAALFGRRAASDDAAYASSQTEAEAEEPAHFYQP